jgi:hypothetical protein
MIMVLVAVGSEHVNAQATPDQLENARRALRYLKTVLGARDPQWQGLLDGIDTNLEIVCEAVDVGFKVQTLADLYRELSETDLDDEGRQVDLSLRMAQCAFDLMEAACSKGFGLFVDKSLPGAIASVPVTFHISAAVFVTTTQLEILADIIEVIDCNMDCVSLAMDQLAQRLPGTSFAEERGKILGDFRDRTGACTGSIFVDPRCAGAIVDPAPGDIIDLGLHNRSHLRFIRAVKRKGVGDLLTYTFYVAGYCLGDHDYRNSFEFVVDLKDDQGQSMIAAGPDILPPSITVTDHPGMTIFEAALDLTVPKLEAHKLTASGNLHITAQDHYGNSVSPNLTLPVAVVEIQEADGIALDAVAGQSAEFVVHINETRGQYGLGTVQAFAAGLRIGDNPATDISGIAKSCGEVTIGPNGSGTLKVILEPPENAALGSYAGTLVVRGSESGGTYCIPLTVNVAADPYAPGVVGDLSGVGTAEGEVVLTWTAPGSNGQHGTAAAYEVRYSMSPITEATWHSAERITDPPRPQSAGSGENLRVTGLLPGAWYHFALKTVDAGGLWSAISNDHTCRAGEYACVEVGVHNPGIGCEDFEYLLEFDEVDLSVCTLEIDYDTDTDPSHRHVLCHWPNQDQRVHEHTWDTRNVPSGNYYLYFTKCCGTTCTRGYAPIMVTINHGDSDNYEPNDTWSEAWGPAEYGYLYSYIQSQGDADWFWFYTDEPLVVKLESIPPGCDYDMILYHFDDDPPHLGCGSPWEVNRSERRGNQDEHLGYSSDGGFFALKVYAHEGYSSGDSYRIYFDYRKDTIPPTCFIGGPCGRYLRCPVPEISWSAWDYPSPGSGAAWMDVQYKDFSQGTWNTWKNHFTGESRCSGRISGRDEFPHFEDGHTYMFRARAMDRMGNVSDWILMNCDLAPLTIDCTLPISCVLPMDSIQYHPSFPVKWRGSDETSGLRHFQISYMKNNSGHWIDWVHTLDTTGTFSRAVDPSMSIGDIYAFRSIAVDSAGNVEVEYSDSGDTRTIIGVDPVPPGSIQDLAAYSGSTDGEILLSWTATGDDGAAGQASSYRIGFSRSTFSTAEWDTIWASSAPLVPKASCLHETVAVRGLPLAETFHLAVSAADEELNFGQVSNVASATAGCDTFPPEFTFGPMVTFWTDSTDLLVAATDEPTRLAVEMSTGGGVGTDFTDSSLSAWHVVALRHCSPYRQHTYICTATDANGLAQVCPLPGHFRFRRSWVDPMVVVIPANAAIRGIEGGTGVCEVAAFDEGGFGVCSGACVWGNRPLEMYLFGDDASTEQDEGLEVGEIPAWRIWSQETSSELAALCYAEGRSPVFTPGATVVIDSIVVTGALELLALSRPEHGNRWNAGARQNVCWCAQGLDSLSITYGDSTGWTTVESSLMAGDSCYQWTIPFDLGTWQIRVCDASDGVPCDSRQFAIIDTVPPMSPMDLEARGSLGRIGLSWTAGRDADIDHYVIYRSLTPMPVDSVAAVAHPGAAYVDRNLSAGTYFYRIAAVDIAGNVSAYSQQVSARYRGIKMEAIQFSAEIGAGETRLHWCLDGSLGKVQGCNILRAQAGDSNHVQINRRILTADDSGCWSYADHSACPDRWSDYFIEVLLTDGTRMRFGPHRVSGQGRPEHPIWGDPNPLDAGCAIKFFARRDGLKMIDIYDLAGRHVRHLEITVAAPGLHEIGWDGCDSQGKLVAPGIYFCRLDSEDGPHTAKLTVLR